MDTQYHEPVSSGRAMLGGNLNAASVREPFIERSEKAVLRMIERLSEASGLLESVEARLGASGGIAGGNTLGGPDKMPGSGTAPSLDAALAALESRVASVFRLSNNISNAL